MTQAPRTPGETSPETPAAAAPVAAPGPDAGTGAAAGAAVAGTPASETAGKLDAAEAAARAAAATVAAAAAAIAATPRPAAAGAAAPAGPAPASVTATSVPATGPAPSGPAPVILPRVLPPAAPPERAPSPAPSPAAPTPAAASPIAQPAASPAAGSVPSMPPPASRVLPPAAPTPRVEIAPVRFKTDAEKPASAAAPPAAAPSPAKPATPAGVQAAGSAAPPKAAPAAARTPESPLPGPKSPPAAPAAAKPSPAPASAARDPLERTSYRAGTLRTGVLCLLFLLLAPFFASLPVMIYQRVAHGLLDDTLSLGLIAIAFAAVMALLVSHMLLSIRARVDVGPKALSFTLPKRASLVTPFGYRSEEIPYDQIAGVELRREIYGGALAPVLMQGARILTKNDRRIPLGYVNEANLDTTLPFPTIARQVAERAGVPLVDRGSVRRSSRKKMLGIMASDDENAPLAESEIVRLNARHRRFMLGLVAGMVALVAFGIIGDLMEPETRLGERAADPASSPAKSPTAPARPPVKK